MQVTFKPTEVQINNPDHSGPNTEKDQETYQKCLEAYLFMEINNLKEFTDNEGNTFIRED